MANLTISEANLQTRPPIVTVLGHVDHGKTTLLDNIRKTNIAAKEHGGITQHISAYQIEITQKVPKTKKEILRKITFIDTPGHEAFVKIRARGSEAADIAILVVAGNDGVMPQTVESINHIKEAKIPCIVAINKIDLPDINLEKIKKQLVKHGLKLEEYGGEIPTVLLSAKTGQGIDKLLEMIILLSDLYQTKEDAHDKFKALVIESSISNKKGILATIIVRSGKIQTAEEVVCEEQSFRIRSLTNWKGERLSEAKAGDPVEMMGWQHLPLVGSILYAKKQSEITSFPKKEIAQKPKVFLLAIPTESSIEEKKIKLIIKTDTAGSLEAIMPVFADKIEIITSHVGPIAESDILLAKTTNAIVIGFNLPISDSVIKLAQTEKVIIKTYNIIYKLFEEIEDVIETARRGDMVELLGEAKVIALFPIKGEIVAGAKVVSGRLARGDQVKIMRGKQVIGRTKIKSLRHHKENITKAEQGMEIGILFSQKLDYLTGDSIIAIG